MNDEHHPRDFESLEPPLDAAVQAALAEPLPEDAIERVKTRAKQLATKPTPMPPRLRRFRPARMESLSGCPRGSAVAAAVLVMVTGAILLLDRSASRAFAQVIEKVKAAEFGPSLRRPRGSVSSRKSTARCISKATDCVSNSLTAC